MSDQSLFEYALSQKEPDTPDTSSFLNPAEVLDRLGIAPSQLRVELQKTVEGILHPLGYDVQVVSFQFNTLTLAAPSAQLGFLRFDLGVLERELSWRFPNLVQSIKLKAL